MKIKNSQALWESVLIILAGIYFYAVYVPWGLGFVTTPSIPVGMYLTQRIGPADQLHVGDEACFIPVMPEWAQSRNYIGPQTKLCKRIAAVTSDRLEVSSDSVTIKTNGRTPALVLKFLSLDSKGRPLTRAKLPGTVPPGFVFVAGTNSPKSFDSRYLGLVPTSIVSHKIYPLITFSND